MRSARYLSSTADLHRLAGVLQQAHDLQPVPSIGQRRPALDDRRRELLELDGQGLSVLDARHPYVTGPDDQLVRGIGVEFPQPAVKAKGIDTVACLAVNDAFVMGAWGREQGTDGKIRMLADGSADYTKALGLELDLSARGLGLRCQRFSMLVDDGVVKALNIEGPGKFEVSDAETMVRQLG